MTSPNELEQTSHKQENQAIVNGIEAVPTHIFISHSKHQEWCEPFIEVLRSYGYTVWCDFDNIYGGQKWVQEIERNLLASNVFIVLLTREAIASIWVNQEIDMAVQMPQKVIIPIICEEMDIPIRPILSIRQRIDVAGLEPKEAAHKVAKGIKIEI